MVEMTVAISSCSPAQVHSDSSNDIIVNRNNDEIIILDIAIPSSVVLHRLSVSCQKVWNRYLMDCDWDWNFHFSAVPIMFLYEDSYDVLGELHEQLVDLSEF